MNNKFPPGVATGNLVQEILKDAKKNNYALPAINVINSNTINTALETAHELNSPIIIQISNGGASFYAGKGLSNENQQASILGAIAAAKHVRTLAKRYLATVILHTDHCAKKLLPWIDGLLIESQKHFENYKKPLFSSHMLDLSEESLEENISICKVYFEKMNKIDIGIEIEIGITGGEEDGVDNSHVDSSKLYTKPQEVAFAYEELKKVSSNFTIAAAFGNVHGVYKPGNILLKPKILKEAQQYTQQKFNTEEKPINFVFHGGSGSSKEEIKEAINYGIIKMNIDTDTQYGFTSGTRDYILNHKDYLANQIGNPEGKELPNKKYYDPRIWLRKGEETLKKRLKEAFEDLNNINTLCK